MSHYTKRWTEEQLRDAIRSLDEKTGLYGAEYPIRLGYGDWRKRLGYFCYGSPEDGEFFFNLDYLNKDWFRETDAIELIRHEYAHYYVWATGLERWIPNERNRRHHGAPWRYACKMVGSTGIVKYQYEWRDLPDISRDVATNRYLAMDVEVCDILRHLERWDCPYLKGPEKEWLNRRLKARTGDNRFFEAPCTAIHPRNGFGVVLETYPSEQGQKVYIMYETGMKEVTTGDQLFKLVDGVVQTKRTD